MVAYMEPVGLQFSQSSCRGALGSTMGRWGSSALGLGVRVLGFGLGLGFRV